MDHYITNLLLYIIYNCSQKVKFQCANILSRLKLVNVSLHVFEVSYVTLPLSMPQNYSLNVKIKISVLDSF